MSGVSMRQDDGKGSARAGALAAGTSYPPIGIAAGVPPDAPASITNVASVSGGGANANAANNASADAVTIGRARVATPVSGSALALLAALLALSKAAMGRRSLRRR